MFDENKYKEMFSQVTASPNTRKRVLLLSRTEKERKRIGLRKIILFTAILVLLISASATVFAMMNGSNWFERMFRMQSKKDLSGSQMEYIDRNTIDISQGVTHDGYTVSVEYALSDGQTLYMNVKLAAPEGVSLGADEYHFVYQNRSQFYPADGSNPPRSGSWEMVNEDPDDNVVYFPMKWHGEGLKHGSQWILDLTDIVECYEREDGSLEEEVIAKGNFRFEITIEGVDDFAMEMLQQPLNYTAKIYDSETEYQEVVIVLTSVVIRPLSAEILFDGYKDTYRLAGFGQMKVVMKDGSTADMTIRSGGNGMNTYAMDVPVVMSEVDHLLLPDGTEIEMPEFSG